MDYLKNIENEIREKLFKLNIKDCIFSPTILSDEHGVVGQLSQESLIILSSFIIGAENGYDALNSLIEYVKEEQLNSYIKIKFDIINNKGVYLFEVIDEALMWRDNISISPLFEILANDEFIEFDDEYLLKIAGDPDQFSKTMLKWRKEHEL